MMGQGFRTLMVAAVCIVIVASCDAVAAPMKLELKLEKGKTYYQRIVTEQRVTQTIMDQQQVIEQSVGNGMKLEVLDMDRQGNMRVRNTFIWSMSRQNGPMGKTEYDSSKQTAPPAGSEPLAALLGQSYIVTLSPTGQVLDANGIEELKEAVHKKLPPGGDQSQMMMVVAPLS
jgi:hypothetical protein